MNAVAVAVALALAADPPVDGPVDGVRAPGIRPSTMRILSMTAESEPQGMDGKSLSLLGTGDQVAEDLARWTTLAGDPCPWLPDGKGAIVAGPEAIRTQREFGDFQLHLEFNLPQVSDSFGQGKANSGVLIHGAYELAILDSFGMPPKIDGCGSIYRRLAPDVNAAEPPGLWQTYDVVFRAPRFADDGSVRELPRVTVLLNGRFVQNNVEIAGRTPPSPTAPLEAADAPPLPATGPIVLQGNPQGVRIRNIWVRVP
jgi:hypothetical protein